MTLPYDYARCAFATCPRADTCARKDPGRPDGQQAFAAFRWRDGCHGYIERSVEQQKGEIK